ARALAGKPVVRFETVLPRLARVDADAPVAGRTVERAESAGKHLLLHFSGGLVLRTHLRMNGSWHLYRPGARWRRPASAMRVRVEVPDAVAVAFDVPVAEWIRAADLGRHPALARLGPDLLSPAFDEAEAERRLRARGALAVADALVDQAALAGAGNELKSEILFVAGVSPFRRVEDLADAELRAVIAAARRLIIAENVPPPGPDGAETRRGGRRTTRRMNPRERTWVYGRGGRPCRKCGAPIAFARQGPHAQATWWCPRCQPGPG
ncbi:DNA-formamidopyrimidine glycosylase family protein, partial [Anaeromyxobacter sp. PSR-1]|uniref:DNA-formamidopyrimidine glycosylase family protein n=1 Tax=Anaeromyxobacter sp. PSR-1 TaxID=1300915 RepID=UPI000751529F